MKIPIKNGTLIVYAIPAFQVIQIIFPLEYTNFLLKTKVGVVKLHSEKSSNFKAVYEKFNEYRLENLLPEFKQY
jgi:hypothetical protein